MVLLEVTFQSPPHPQLALSDSCLWMRFNPSATTSAPSLPAYSHVPHCSDHGTMSPRLNDSFIDFLGHDGRKVTKPDREEKEETQAWSLTALTPELGAIAREQP